MIPFFYIDRDKPVLPSPNHVLITNLFTFAIMPPYSSSIFMTPTTIFGKLYRTNINRFYWYSRSTGNSTFGTTNTIANKINGPNEWFSVPTRNSLDLSSRTSGSGCRLQQIDPTVFATTDFIYVHSFILENEEYKSPSINQ